jgi:DNA polymerase-3 subunit beta
MEFTIGKNDFLQALRHAQSIADRKSTMPMLANVLLRTSGKKTLLIAATDLNVSVSAEAEAKTKKEGGLTVGAKALHDIVASLPGDTVTMQRADNHWAEIKAGSVSYRLVGMPDRDFPKIPDHREVTFSDVDAGGLRDMLEKTLISVCHDETRFHLNGILFESDGKRARMVSTDGHRLSKVERELPGGPVLTAGVIIPKKGATEIRRALDGLSGACKLAIKTPHLFLLAGDLCLAIKLIDSQFPPYQQVIPTANDKVVVVPRAPLLDGLRRAQLMTSDTRGVRLAVSQNVLSLTGDNPDVGDVREEMEATYTGPDVSIGFNPKYVAEILGQMKEAPIRLELAGELDPVLIRSESDPDYVGVIMPMRL